MKLACKYHKDSNTITLHFPDKFDSINLSDGSVTTAKLASGSVTTLKIVDEAIEAVKLATASITSEKVATAAIGSSHLQDALVTTAKIANLAVDASRLADLTITAGKLASSCVEASKIANLAVGAAAIASGAIGTAKIADAAILEAKIDNAAVTSAKIYDAAIVSAKIADLAVIEAKIGNLAVNNAKLANLAVTTAKINDLAVTNAKVSNLDAGKITTGTLVIDRTAAKCTDANADQTSAHTAANAATYTGSLILTSYTTAKCTDANADQTSANGQNLGWIIGTGGELTISSGGKLKLNTTDALEIQAAGNIKVLAGGDVDFTGSSYKTTLNNNASGNHFNIEPDTTDVNTFRIGYVHAFYDIVMYATNHIGLHGKVIANTDVASNWAATFINDGNNANRYGIKIQCGLDNDSGEQHHIYFYDGDGDYQGTLTNNTSGNLVLVNASDEKLKTDIIDAPDFDTNKIINGLQLREYTLRGSPGCSGLVAQEAQTVFPEMIMEIETKKDGMLLCVEANTKLTFVLLQAIKELKAEVAILKGEKL